MSVAILQERAAKLVQEAEVNSLRVRIEDIQRHETHIRELRDRAEASSNRLREELDRVSVGGASGPTHVASYKQQGNNDSSSASSVEYCSCV